MSGLQAVHWYWAAEHSTGISECKRNVLGAPIYCLSGKGPTDRELDSEILTLKTNEMPAFPCLAGTAGVSRLTS